MENEQSQERRRNYDTLESEVSRDLLNFDGKDRPSKIGWNVREHAQVKLCIEDFDAGKDARGESIGAYSIESVMDYIGYVPKDYARRFPESVEEAQRKKIRNGPELWQLLEEIDTIAKQEYSKLGFRQTTPSFWKKDVGEQWYRKRDQALSVYLDCLAQDLVEGSEFQELATILRLLEIERDIPSIGYSRRGYEDFIKKVEELGNKLI